MSLLFSQFIRLYIIRLYIPLSGYSYEDPLSLSEYPDGTKRAYATISYANGPGYHVHFNNDSAVPWKDMRDFVIPNKTNDICKMLFNVTNQKYCQDFEDKDFLNPAMMPGPEKEESHGGEDVAIYAIGI